MTSTWRRALTTFGLLMLVLGEAGHVFLGAIKNTSLLKWLILMTTSSAALCKEVSLLRCLLAASCNGVAVVARKQTIFYSLAQHSRPRALRSLWLRKSINTKKRLTLQL